MGKYVWFYLYSGETKCNLDPIDAQTIQIQWWQCSSVFDRTHFLSNILYINFSSDGSDVCHPQMNSVLILHLHTHSCQTFLLQIWEKERDCGYISKEIAPWTSNWPGVQRKKMFVIVIFHENIRQVKQMPAG